MLFRSNDCNVLLDGQTGNYSISFGDFDTYFATQLLRFRYREMHRAIVKLARFRNLKAANIYKYIMKRILKDSLAILQQQRSRWYPKNIIKGIEPLLIKRNKMVRDILKQMRSLQLGEHSVTLMPIEFNKRLISSGILFSHSAIAEAKLSLAYGITKRDPTKDKRVLEYCLSVPIEQWVRDGVERSLIRRSLADLLPRSIIANHRYRGAQAPDWLQRMRCERESIIAEMNQMQHHALELDIINLDTINRLMETYSLEGGMGDSESIEKMMRGLIVSRFILRFKERRYVHEGMEQTKG